jgi:hypothetical protein
MALDKDLPKLVERAKQAALAGDTVALKLLLDRALPMRKATAPVVELPALAQARTLHEKAGAVMDAVAQGQLPPDVAAQLIGALGQAGNLAQLHAFEERLESLEAELRMAKGCAGE